MTLVWDKSPGLRYLKVLDFLRRKIQEGEYKPNDRLPKQHDLAKELSVSWFTLKRALDILDEEGYVVRKTGQGTFVTLPEEHPQLALVVDDDEKVREFFTRALARSGWESVVVESGEIALEKVKEQRFDLMLLDLAMAGMNGADTLRNIRRIDPEANVVIITAYPNSALMSQALQSGPIKVMQKPINLDELRGVLGDAASASGVRGRERRMEGTWISGRGER